MYATHMKVTSATVAISILLLASCSKNAKDDFTGTSSALEPVGMEYHKQEAKRRADESKFKAGQEVTFRNSQVMLYDRNPERYTTSGQIVPTSNATVVAGDGLFVRVKLGNGRTGYVSESDLIDPMENFGFGAFGEDTGLMPAFLTDESLSELPPGLMPPDPSNPPVAPDSDTTPSTPAPEAPKDVPLPSPDAM